MVAIVHRHNHVREHAAAALIARDTVVAQPYIRLATHGFDSALEDAVGRKEGSCLFVFLQVAVTAELQYDLPCIPCSIVCICSISIAPPRVRFLAQTPLTVEFAAFRQDGIATKELSKEKLRQMTGGKVH